MDDFQLKSYVVLLCTPSWSLLLLRDVVARGSPFFQHYGTHRDTKCSGDTV